MTISLPNYRLRELLSLVALLFAVCAVSLPVFAQSANSPGPPPTAPPQFLPTDITPYTTRDRNVFAPGYRFKLFKFLPERLWFNVRAETSQRLDTNALFTARNGKADYAFRVLPNISVGYNILRNTSLYANYFAIKDVFARDYSNINFPTTQSLSWGIQHIVPLGKTTNLQFNAQARELWLTSHVRFFDLLPGATLTKVVSPNSIVFFSTLLQLRGSQYFVPANREIDPFYTIGWTCQRGFWSFIATDTYVTNFRRHDSVPTTSNQSMIMDLEVNHPVSKRLPSLLAFVRAEPIWNFDSHRMPGISGFDFRLYGGLRFVLSKPSYYGQIKDLRNQLKQSEESSSLNSPASNKTN